MKALIGPVGEWVALPQSMEVWSDEFGDVLVESDTLFTPDDVLAVVERWFDHDDNAGWDRVGFVRVDDVLPIVDVRPSLPWEGVEITQAGQRIVWWPDGSATEIELPDAEPGGVALRLEPTECPTCGGFGALQENVENVSMALRCPECTGPVTVTGDGPIVEVTP